MHMVECGGDQQANGWRGKQAGGCGSGSGWGMADRWWWCGVVVGKVTRSLFGVWFGVWFGAWFMHWLLVLERDGGGIDREACKGQMCPHDHASV